LKRLLCIFPFEQEFFTRRGVPTTFIGHPLAGMVKPSLSREEFCTIFGIANDSRIIALLPGSRQGEFARHTPILLEAARIIQAKHPVKLVMALPPGFGSQAATLRERVRAASIQVLEGYTWDVLAQSELALAASGTVTIEAALLGIPMVTFYRVNALS